MNVRIEDFDGSQAAPLLIVGEDADPTLVAFQDQLAINFEAAVYEHLAQYAKPSVLKFVSHAIVSRLKQREGENGSSYDRRGNHKPDVRLFPDLTKKQVLEACRLAEQGKGRAVQNEIARHAYKMRTIEYRNLTIIGEFRSEFERPMLADISELVDADATPHASQMYGLRLLGFDRDIRSSQHIGAMRIGMKRTIGQTAYGAQVKGRTTASINMSPSSGVDPDLVEAMREAKVDGRDIALLPEFINAVGWLIETDLPPGFVLARNETVYGVAEATD